ncbi:Alpha-1-antiproteinase [Bienertia sinuspersici]
MESIGRRTRAVLGSPLMQVFSVSIKPYGDICQVYGTIEVIDDIGELYLYNCNPKDAETIHKNGTLSLMLADRAISAAADITVNFDLKEKNRNGNRELIKESFSFNGPNMFSYANCLSHDFRGKLGVSTMYFSVLSVALDAAFSISFARSFGSDGANVHGRIIAYYGANFSSLVDDKMKEHFQFTLFDKKPDEAVRVERKACIPCLEEAVCVPSYSSLVFQADLYYTRFGDDKEENANFKVEIQARADNMEQRDCSAFNIFVECTHPNRTARSPSVEMSTMDKFEIDGYNICELFSARIFYDQRTAEDTVEVYGAIRADDGFDDTSLFYSRKKHLNRILPDGTLTLTGPTRAIRGSNFEINLDVTEMHQKFSLNGRLLLTPAYPWDWTDCLTCAAASGKNCYGVLYFAIFQNAVQAHLEITLSSGTDTTIYGSLIAYYENFEYKSDYLKTYFRTRLLDVPEDKPIKVLSGMPIPESDDELVILKNKLIEVGESSVLSNVTEDEVMAESKDEMSRFEDVLMQPEDEPVGLEHRPVTVERTRIPLSRNVVAVPDSSSLIIEANLSCKTRIGNVDSVTRLVQGSSRFQPKDSGITTAQIGNGEVFIDVKASFSSYWYRDPGKLPIETKRLSSVEVSSEKKSRLT